MSLKYPEIFWLHKHKHHWKWPFNTDTDIFNSYSHLQNRWDVVLLAWISKHASSAITQLYARNWDHAHTHNQGGQRPSPLLLVSQFSAANFHQYHGIVWGSCALEEQYQLQPKSCCQNDRLLQYRSTRCLGDDLELSKWFSSKSRVLLCDQLVTWFVLKYICITNEQTNLKKIL